MIHTRFLFFLVLTWDISWTTCLSTTTIDGSHKVVAVVGATGRLGRELVRQLSDRGYSCRILVRPHFVQQQQQQQQQQDMQNRNSETTSPSQMKKNFDFESLMSLPGVTAVIPGDVTDVDALSTLLQGCSACFAVYGTTRRSQIQDLWTNPSENDPAHAKSVNYQGVVNLLHVIDTQNPRTCQRIVRITGNGETPYSFFSILINLLGNMAKAWNYEGEQLLQQQTDVKYTIIQPGIMTESPSPVGSQVCITNNGQKLPVSPILYMDDAALCINCWEHSTTTAQCTLTAMTTTDSKASFKNIHL
jgi:NAD(P)-dependent dehydrogenase (short-subunit alcohol dehydrogenase family)